MARRKCSAKQLAALRRGREKLAHKRSKKNTKGSFGQGISDTFANLMTLGLYNKFKKH